MKTVGALAGAAIQQGEKLQAEAMQAETTWFHVFRDMIENGDVAKMGPHGFTVYAVIKAHTNFSTGQSFPSLETISAKSGVSLPQVKRELTTLVQLGYLTKRKDGRRNVFTLREKIVVRDGDGTAAAVASWDYLPASLQQSVADIKNVLMTGDLAGAKIVHIERLQVNFVTVRENGVNINIQELLRDIDKLHPKVRATLQKRLEEMAKNALDAAA